MRRAEESALLLHCCLGRGIGVGAGGVFRRWRGDRGDQQGWAAGSE